MVVNIHVLAVILKLQSRQVLVGPAMFVMVQSTHVYMCARSRVRLAGAYSSLEN